MYRGGIDRRATDDHDGIGRFAPRYADISHAIGGGRVEHLSEQGVHGGGLGVVGAHARDERVGDKGVLGPWEGRVEEQVESGCVDEPFAGEHLRVGGLGGSADFGDHGLECLGDVDSFRARQGVDGLEGFGEEVFDGLEEVSVWGGGDGEITWDGEDVLEEGCRIQTRRKPEGRIVWVPF